MIELCEATEDNPFIHGMSKQFVKALQQLFDVMDTDNTGTIKYVDLATQWEEDQSDPFFPKGLITCLAKVTLPNGLLTFDRFCAGIKLCLLKNQVELKDVKEDEGLGNDSSQEHSSLTDRPSSEPQVFAPPPPPPLPPSMTSSHMTSSSEINNNTSLFNNNHTTKNASLHSSSSFSTNLANSTNLSDDSKSKKLPLPSYEQVMAAKSKSMSKLTLDNLPSSSHSLGCEDLTIFALNGATKSSNSLYVKPTDDQTRRNLNLYENFALLSNESTRYPSNGFSQRAKSMSNLENISSTNSAPSQEPKQVNPEFANRSTGIDHKSVTSATLVRNGSQNVPQQPKTLSRNCIIKTLQSWRDNILHKQVIDPSESLPISKSGTELSRKSITADISMMKETISPEDAANELNINSLRRNVPTKRREPRRHTVGANGIDLYTIKRFQQLEQEKDILTRGLNEIDKTKEWYKRQVACIQDKINLAGRAGSFPSDCNIDAYQERINFQATRIQNLNQHLVALREANHNFPLHMNLAIRPFNGVRRMDPNQPKQLVLNPNLVNKLKEQNRLLTEEVSRKSERITQLEREKSSLIRELFQARTYSSYYSGDFDDTFM